MNQDVPKLFKWIIRLLASERDQHIIEGDLQQLLYETKRLPLFTRLWIILKEASGLIRLSLTQQQMRNRPTGIHYNLFLTIFRSLVKRPLFSFINLFGLSTSLLCVLFIFTYVNHELSFDKYHDNHDKIFRITYQEDETEPVGGHWARVPVDWINEMADVFPQIESFARFQDFWPRNVKVGDKVYREEFAYSVDASVTKIFDFEFLEGEEDALNQPNSAILTESIAKRYFADQEALGKEFITYRADGMAERFEVKAIIVDMPSNSHLPINFLTTINQSSNRTGWAYTYIKLHDDAKAKDVEDKLRDFVTARTESDPIEKLNLQPIADIHLTSHLSREITQNSRMSYIIIFGFVGILILGIAVINFANLNTLQSLSRTKEVGMRKVLGGSKSQTFKYFLFEAFIITLGALSLAFLIFFIAKSPIERSLDIESIMVDPIKLALFGVSLLITIPLLSSLYPSRILSNLPPLIALKSNTGLGSRSVMKKVLLGIQFAMASALISCLFIIQKQFVFLQNKNLGFEKDNVLVIEEIPDESKRQIATIKSELLRIPGVENVSAIMELPARAVKDGVALNKPHQKDNEGVGMDIQIVDEDFYNLLGLEMAAGSWLTYKPVVAIPPVGTSFDGIMEYFKQQPRDYVINETAAKQMGWDNPQDAIGQKVKPWNPFYELRGGQIAGVLKDYHQESLRASVDPVVMTIEPIWLRHCLVKIEAGQFQSTISHIENYWQTHYPESPFETTFLDMEWDRLYRAEQTQMTLIRSFSILAIMIAVLGLFGVLGYILKTRSKEMAVRRVIGANQQLLATMVSKEYLTPILIGGFLSAPLIWYTMKTWLDEYAYHITMPYQVFGITLMITGIIAITAICTQVITNAKNPVDVLRSE